MYRIPFRGNGAEKGERKRNLFLLFLSSPAQEYISRVCLLRPFEKGEEERSKRRSRGWEQGARIGTGGGGQRSEA